MYLLLLLPPTMIAQCSDNQMIYQTNSPSCYILLVLCMAPTGAAGGAHVAVNDVCPVTGTVVPLTSSIQISMRIANASGDSRTDTVTCNPQNNCAYGLDLNLDSAIQRIVGRVQGPVSGQFAPSNTILLLVQDANFEVVFTTPDIDASTTCVLRDFCCTSNQFRLTQGVNSVTVSGNGPRNSNGTFVQCFKQVSASCQPASKGGVAGIKNSCEGNSMPGLGIIRPACSSTLDFAPANTTDMCVASALLPTVYHPLLLQPRWHP